MESEGDLEAAAVRSFIGSYRTLVDHVDDAATGMFGRVFAFRTGLPISIFNGVIIDEVPHPDDVEGALDWVEAYRDPYVLCVPEAMVPALAPLTDRRGMRQAPWLMPHMVLTPIPDTVPPPPAGITVRGASDPRSRALLRDVMAASGMAPGVAARLVPDAFLLAEDVQAFVAELTGNPAGTSIAIRTDDIAGVYAVGTVPSARRRGVGTAATWAAVAAARTWGSPLVALQSSEMGAGVYAAMGFRIVARFAQFSPAREAGLELA